MTAIVINEVIRDAAPFLSDADQPKIDRNKLQALYFLDKYWPVKPANIEDEASYDNLQRMLIGKYTALKLVEIRAIENASSNAGNNKVVKRAKADVVETEFEYTKDGQLITLDTRTLISNLKEDICQTAQTLEMWLPMCECAPVTLPAFKVYH
jgi:hypothetical protein